MAISAQLRERFAIPAAVAGSAPLTIAALRADIRLYFDVPFDEIADDFLPVFDDLWSWAGRARFRWWRHESMPLWEPMGHRTHVVLPTALRRGLPRDLGLFAAKGVDPASGPNGTFQVADVGIAARWHTRGGRFFGDAAGELRVLDGIDRMLEDTDAWRDRVLSLCEALPVKSGVSGLVAEQEGLALADMAKLYGAAMRHPGVDLDNGWNLSMAAPDAIKGVNWLTVVGRSGVERLGGAAALRRRVGGSIIVHDTRHAVVLQAGPKPVAGDSNRGDRLPEYRTVYDAVKDLHEAMIETATPFQMGRPDDRDRTEAWLRRFDPGSP